jgi:hypothetical protein
LTAESIGNHRGHCISLIWYGFFPVPWPLPGRTAANGGINRLHRRHDFLGNRLSELNQL